VTPLLAALVLAGTPLECPPGAERRGGVPPEGQEEWCEAADRYGKPLRDGPARTYYDDGTTWVEEAWRRGQRDGPFLERYRGGRKAREGTYREGQKDGRWTVWFEDGRVAEESTFRAGVPDGPFKAFWESGALRTEGRRCGGSQCGTWRTYAPDGRELGSVRYSDQRDAP
jgi:antitoxin component YwqK of YwqJK toxin-antitoxin module